VLCCYDKYLRKTTKRKKDLFWLTISEVSVSHGEKSVVKWLTSESQEAEKENSSARFPPPPFTPSELPAYWILLPTCRVDPPSFTLSGNTLLDTAISVLW
jgi:hypothetical protein